MRSVTSSHVSAGTPVGLKLYPRPICQRKLAHEPWATVGLHGLVSLEYHVRSPSSVRVQPLGFSNASSSYKTQPHYRLPPAIQWHRLALPSATKGNPESSSQRHKLVGRIANYCARDTYIRITASQMQRSRIGLRNYHTPSRIIFPPCE